MNSFVGEGGLTGLMAFVRTAQTGSFAKGAAALGLTASGVSKSVQRLEDRLGVPLFIRTTRSLSLTLEGRQLLGHAERILEVINDAEEELSLGKGNPVGRLKASLAPGIGRALVIPLLNGFMTRYPDIELDIDFNGRNVDLINEGYDLVLRTGAMADSGLVGRRLLTISSVLCAAPSYLSGKSLKSPSDLTFNACIRYRLPTSGRLQPWVLHDAPENLVLPQTLVFTDPDAVRQAAVAGLGIASLPVYMVRRHFDEGTLVETPGVSIDNSRASEAWLLWPRGRQHSPKLRAFVDYLVDNLQGASFTYTNSSTIADREGSN